MKRVPTEAELLEILELARGAAQKSRKLHQILLKNSARWQSLRRSRLATKRKTAGTENVSAES
jgi:hypothetical protein